MRSEKPRKPKTGLLIAVLLVLGALQIAAGTFMLLGVRRAMDQGTLPDVLDEMEIPGIYDAGDDIDGSDGAYSDDDVEGAEDAGPDGSDFDDAGDEDGVADTDDADKDDADDADKDDEDNDDKDDADKDKDDDDDDKAKNKNKKKKYVVMTVRASDNFAAVRTGPGTAYAEVGRITNGHKVALTDLHNGWYRIARGKYKGYYTHESSYVSD